MPDALRWIVEILLPCRLHAGVYGSTNGKEHLISPQRDVGAWKRGVGTGESSAKSIARIQAIGREVEDPRGMGTGRAPRPRRTGARRNGLIDGRRSAACKRRVDRRRRIDSVKVSKITDMVCIYAEQVASGNEIGRAHV